MATAISFEALNLAATGSLSTVLTLILFCFFGVFVDVSGFRGSSYQKSPSAGHFICLRNFVYRLFSTVNP